MAAFGNCVWKARPVTFDRCGVTSGELTSLRQARKETVALSWPLVGLGLNWPRAGPLHSHPRHEQPCKLSAGVSKERRPNRKSTRLNSSHLVISYAVFCLKKKKSSADIRKETHQKKTPRQYQ